MPGDLVGQSLAHFRIVEKLGEGGMGVVYKATDEKLGRTVAVKVLPEHFADSQERRQRFLREARSAAAVTHANIATVYEIGEAGGRVFIAMEFIGGRSLRDLLAERMPVPEALRIAKNIALGLGAAHESGVVHRDLKPENVMVTAKGEVKILDFGLAKLDEPRSPAALGEAKTEQQITEDGRVLGTPAYMSPEQARGETVDARSDVFSFGVMLYEMLAGARPFQGGTAVAILLAVTTKEPEPVASLNADVTPEVSTVVARCLEKLPGSRYANGQDLTGALAAVPPEPRVSEPSSSRKAPRAPTVSLLTPAVATVAPRGSVRWPWRLAILVGLVTVGLVMGLRADRTTARTMGASTETGDGAGSSAPSHFRARRLAALAAGSYLSGAALSPDGLQLAFTDPDGLWLQAVGGGSRAKLGPIDKSVRDPAFLPDGRHILLSGDHLWLASLDGGSARQLPDRLDWGSCRSQVLCFARVSPDGLNVAVNRDHAIEIAPLDGSGEAATVATLANEYPREMRFSPDGKHIAYFDVIGGNAALLVARVDGAGSTKLFEKPAATFETGAEYTLAWPEPNRLVFGVRNEEEGTCSLEEIAVDDTGHPTSPPEHLWSTRGDHLGGLTITAGRIAVAVEDIQFQVFVAAVNSDGSIAGVPRQLTKNRSKNYPPRWLPDGRVAFVSTRDARRAIYAQGLDDAEATLLVEPPLSEGPLQDVLGTGELLYLRPVDPDGGKLSRLFGLIPGGHERAFEIRTTDLNFRLRCAAGDPAKCVMAEGRPWVDLSLVDLAADRAEPRFARTRCENLDLAVTPDQRTVALTCNDGQVRLATVAGAGSSVRTLGTTIPYKALQTLAFAPDGRSLLVTVQDPTVPAPQNPICALLGVGLDGHTRVLLSSNRTWFGAPTVSPNGKMLAWGEFLPEDEVWVLESP